MNKEDLNKSQLKQMEINVVKFNLLMERAYEGKLTTHKEVCGFQLLAPINDRVYTNVIFHGYPVAHVYAKDKIDILGFNKIVWGKLKYKYDVLCEVVAGIVGVEEEPKKLPQKPVKTKPAVKRKPVTRKRKPATKKKK